MIRLQNGKFLWREVWARPHLGWSNRGCAGNLGVTTPGPNQILLNRQMDSSPVVPRFCGGIRFCFTKCCTVKHPTPTLGFAR